MSFSNSMSNAFSPVRAALAQGVGTFNTHVLSPACSYCAPMAKPVIEFCATGVEHACAAAESTKQKCADLFSSSEKDDDEPVDMPLIGQAQILLYNNRTNKATIEVQRRADDLQKHSDRLPQVTKSADARVAKVDNDKEAERVGSKRRLDDLAKQEEDERTSSKRRLEKLANDADDERERWNRRLIVHDGKRNEALYLKEAELKAFVDREEQLKTRVKTVVDQQSIVVGQHNDFTQFMAARVHQQVQYLHPNERVQDVTDKLANDGAGVDDGGATNANTAEEMDEDEVDDDDRATMEVTASNTVINGTRQQSVEEGEIRMEPVGADDDGGAALDEGVTKVHFAPM